MEEIYCDVVSPTEASVEVSKLSPRTARRRRMQIRRSRCLGEAEATAKPDRKKQRMSSSPPPPTTPPHSCSTTRLYGNVSVSSSSSDSESPRELGRESAPQEAAPPTPGVLDACPKYGTTSVCGRRREMEDAVSVRPEFSQQANKHHFFGVYDGHGCSHVAASCKERMHEMVADELAAVARGGAAHLRWQEIMERSFSRMDAEVGNLRRDNNKISSCRCEAETLNSDHVGSTAVVAVVGPEKIVVANCGDSRAVLCRGGVPIRLSDDHKPDRPDELRRIEEAGGRVIYWDGARVLGVLAMSRAIGDNYLKPFVISEPEVTVTERSDDDECLILASDGLWDVLTNEMACDIARMCLRSGNRSAAAGGGEKGLDKACSAAAMLLTKVALARQSADNVSVVVVDLRRR